MFKGCKGTITVVQNSLHVFQIESACFTVGELDWVSPFHYLHAKFSAGLPHIGGDRRTEFWAANNWCQVCECELLACRKHTYSFHFQAWRAGASSARRMKLFSRLGNSLCVARSKFLR